MLMPRPNLGGASASGRPAASAGKQIASTDSARARARQKAADHRTQIALILLASSWLRALLRHRPAHCEEKGHEQHRREHRRAKEHRLREIRLKAQDDEADDQRAVITIDRPGGDQIEDLFREQINARDEQQISQKSSFNRDRDVTAMIIVEHPAMILVE